MHLARWIANLALAPFRSHARRKQGNSNNCTIDRRDVGRVALSRTDILQLVANFPGPPDGPLLQPFEESRMGPCSYDLSVGNEYYCYRDIDKDVFVPRQLPKQGQIQIPPNRCAFVITEEVIKMPLDVMGLVALRFELTKLGIMLSPQAPIDPGYTGKIMMMLYNLSDQPRTLARGEAFVTISFHRMESATAPYSGPNQGVQSLLSFFPMQARRPVKTSLSRTEEQLDQRAAELETQMKQVREERGRLLTTVLGVAAMVLAAAALIAALIPITLTLQERDEPGPSPSFSQPAATPR